MDGLHASAATFALSWIHVKLIAVIDIYRITKIFHN